MNSPRLGRFLFVALILCAVLATGAPRWVQAAPAIVDPGQGTFVFSGSGSTELSGITYAGGTSYFAVSDNTPVFYPLSVSLNLSTGFVTSVNVGSGVTMTIGGSAISNSPKYDAEGIAYDSASGQLWIVSEQGTVLNRHDPVTGNANVIALITGPGTESAVYVNHRPDFGLESVTRSSTTGDMWIANEESLTTDGPQPTPTTGTAVRLQLFKGAGGWGGQWAYITDPDRGPITFPSFPTQTFSGVSDMQLLPDGSMLVLERAFGGSDGAAGLPQFRSRIYFVAASEFAAGKSVAGISNLDTAPLDDLSGEPWQPAVAKTLLWEHTFASADFDGITIGQTLANGDLSLLLIADDQGGLGTQGVYPLRLVGALVPEPGALALFGSGAAVVLLLGQMRRRAGDG
jgi:hypothetical protein